MQERILIHGLRYAVETIPSPVSTATNTLILLHGFTGSATSWHPYSDLLAADQKVIAIDLPGHGDTDSLDDPARYSIEHTVADIGAIQEHLHLLPAETIILGYSMGGRVAIAAALAGVCRAVILESASPGLADDVAREQRRSSDEALAKRIESEGIASFISYWEQLPLFAGLQQLPASERQQIHAQRLQNNPVGLSNSLRGLGTGTQPSYWQQLNSLQLPVLLIVGTNDQKFVAVAQQMAQSLPQSQLHIVTESGHTVHREQSTQFTTVVRQFCRTLDPTIFV